LKEIKFIIVDLKANYTNITTIYRDN
jgi:hypothetical protein